MTAAKVTPDLAALVGSRFAHDLASPVGAIANGVELLALTGYDAQPELALIAESVKNARTRIKLFRIAFGSASHGQDVPEADIAELTAPAGGKRDVVVDWTVPGAIARQDAKIAFLALMCLETAMPWGGQVQVSRDDGRWQVDATADRLSLDPALWDHLAGATAAPDTLVAAQVHFLLLAGEIRAQARHLGVERRATGIKIAF